MVSAISATSSSQVLKDGFVIVVFVIIALLDVQIKLSRFWSVMKK